MLKVLKEIGFGGNMPANVQIHNQLYTLILECSVNEILAKDQSV